MNKKIRMFDIYLLTGTRTPMKFHQGNLIIFFTLGNR
jgi:hypothetical protein